jgi:prevent-host-death family protein
MEEGQETRKDRRPMTRLAMSAFRAALSDAMGRVAYGKEPIIIQRSGKDFAAIVPMEALELLEAVEDRFLIEAADEAEAEAEGQPLIPWEESKRKLGW